MRWKGSISEIKPEISLRLFFAGRWALAVTLILAAACAGAQQNAALSAQAIAWANQNLGPYKTYHQFASHRQQPRAIVPPQIDFPCQLCGQSATSQNQANAENWVKQSMEPEKTYMTGLLSMANYIAKLKSSPWNNLTHGQQMAAQETLPASQIQQMKQSNWDKLSPAAQQAIEQFDDPESMINDTRRIADDLVNDAGEMATRYDRDPTRAYAGTMLVSTVQKQLQLLGERSDHPLISIDLNNESRAEMQVLQQWLGAVRNTIDNDIFSGHKYNLCPVYMSIIRQILTAGGSAGGSLNSASDYTELLGKLNKATEFDLNLKLVATGVERDGSNLHATWIGKAKLKLNVNLDQSCYTPQWEDAKGLQVVVQNFHMTGIDKHSDGTTEEIPVTLASDPLFYAKLPAPLLNLCDPSPIFQMPMVGAYPQEIIKVKGKDSKGSFFGPFMAMVIGTNEVNSSESNAVTGATPSLPGGSQNSQQNTGGSGSAGLEATKAEIEAHKNDVSWLMGPAGQAAMAKLQQQALASVQSKIAAKGIVVPQASNFAQFGQSLTSAHLPWTNGQTQPVNKTLHVKKDNNDFELTVTVQQASQ